MLTFLKSKRPRVHFDGGRTRGLIELLFDISMSRTRKPRPRGRRQSKEMTRAIAVLTALFTHRILRGEFDGAWSLDDLTRMATRNTYISDKDKHITYRALCMVRWDIKNSYGKCIYKVKGKGFVILNTLEDHVQVFNRGIDVVKGFTRSLLHPVARSGKLTQLRDNQIRSGIEEVQKLLGVLNGIQTKQLTN